MPDKTKPQAQPRRGARAITPQYLERAALHYLERFAASSANLRRVLKGRILRARRAGGEVPDEPDAMVEEVIAKLVRLNLIDDTAFAMSRGAALRRRGGSARQIRGKLKLAGIDGGTIAEALESADAERGETAERGEMRAALRLAQRRRLGPYRPAGERAELRRRDLAALARAGFSLDVARRIVDADDPDALLDDD